MAQESRQDTSESIFLSSRATVLIDHSVYLLAAVFGTLFFISCLMVSLTSTTTVLPFSTLTRTFSSVLHGRSVLALMLLLISSGKESWPSHLAEMRSRSYRIMIMASSRNVWISSYFRSHLCHANVYYHKSHLHIENSIEVVYNSIEVHLVYLHCVIFLAIIYIRGQLFEWKESCWWQNW